MHEMIDLAAPFGGYKDKAKAPATARTSTPKPRRVVKPGLIAVD